MTLERDTPDYDVDAPPPHLVDDLADLFDARLLVPAQVDDAVLAAARQRLAPLRRRGSRRMWVGLVTGAAAAAVVGMTVWLGSMNGMHTPGNASPMVRGDLNHDGVINIVDAMLLEQRAASGGADVTNDDFNHDGKVDRDDAIELAHRAVTLNNGGVL